MKIKNFQTQENQRFSGPENSGNKFRVFSAFKLQDIWSCDEGVRIK